MLAHNTQIPTLRVIKQEINLASFFYFITLKSEQTASRQITQYILTVRFSLFSE